MTLKQLADQLNKYNLDDDIGEYRVSEWRGMDSIDCLKKHGGGYILPREEAEERLKHFKEAMA